MQDLVGIIRKADEIETALKELEELRHRLDRITVGGDRPYNPGWHLAVDLRNMLLVSECVARAALEREESRGGHTRDDFPATDKDYWGTVNVICRPGEEAGGQVVVTRQPLPVMPPELQALMEYK